ncbi:hypothetical protein [Komagataeibacter europaeus]|uniref:hypothetical protein n=1 Tax=Komagataeibacter europaeus TaxID=33995 RepID=UPI0013A07E16|nr:hypothetical protein [Komagataeibacter europaeus]
MKLFSKSFKEHGLFEKRRHPETFIFYQWIITHEKKGDPSGPPSVSGMQEQAEGIRN